MSNDAPKRVRHYTRSTKSRSLRSHVELEQILSQTWRTMCRAAAERLVCMWVLMAHTGLRPGECVLLKVCQVYRGGVVVESFILPATMSKTKIEDAEIVLPEAARAALQAWLEYSGLKDMPAGSWLFPPARNSHTAQPYYYFDRHVKVTTLEKDMRRILESLGHDPQQDGHVSPYSLRKYFANTVHSAAQDLRVTQRAMRHLRVSSTDHYISAEPAMVRAAILQAFGEPAAPAPPRPAVVSSFAAVRGKRAMVKVCRIAA